jgi:hypothetical protein
MISRSKSHVTPLTVGITIIKSTLAMPHASHYSGNARKPWLLPYTKKKKKKTFILKIKKNKKKTVFKE